MIKQLCKNCWQNVILYQICCAQGQVLPLRDSAHFVRPRVCSANYPIIDFFWQDFVLQKIVRVRIPCCLINKKIKGIANAIPFILGGEWGIRTLGPVRDYLISNQVAKTEPGGIWRKITADARNPKMPCFQGFPHLFASKTQWKSESESLLRFCRVLTDFRKSLLEFLIEPSTFSPQNHAFGSAWKAPVMPDNTQNRVG